MSKRTSPSDAARIILADDLEEIVQDKRADWRAGGARARRRQRRYKNLLTQQLVRSATGQSAEIPDAPDL